MTRASVAAPLRDAMEHVVDQVVDLRVAVAGHGSSMAVSYLDGAVVALRYALAIMLRLELDAPLDASERSGCRRVVFADGTPTDVFVTPSGHEGVVSRVRLTASGLERDLDADVGLRQHQAVDLGVDLTGCEAARRLASSPVGAAMLHDALVQRSWLHPAGEHPWSVGASGARSLVAVLAGGRQHRQLADHLRGRVVDERVLRVIEGLGWRRYAAERDG